MILLFFGNEIQRHFDRRRKSKASQPIKQLKPTYLSSAAGWTEWAKIASFLSEKFHCIVLNSKSDSGQRFCCFFGDALSMLTLRPLNQSVYNYRQNSLRKRLL
jgi:hypothetical protein